MIIGIDEAGRGCWAGPLVAAAVRLHHHVDGLMDSKLLKPAKRIQLATAIKQHADVGIGWVSAKTVDDIGLTAATTKAMTEALNMLERNDSQVLIDGNYNYLQHIPNVQTMVKADLHIAEVSAASIIAKTSRDAYMIHAALEYPEYLFDRHVGYGTALHRELLIRYGPCVEHRLSYKPLQKIMSDQSV